MMLGVIFWESFRDAMRPGRMFIWVFLGLLCALLAGVWHNFQQVPDPSDAYIAAYGLGVLRLLPLASAIYMTSIIGREVDQKTIVYLLTRPVARWQYIVGRYFANVLAVGIIGTFTTLCTSLGAFHQLTNPMIWYDILAVFLGALSYGALFLLVSLMLNRALIVCVMFAFGWEISVPNLAAGIQKLSILSHLQAISQHEASDEGNIMDIASGSANAELIGRPMGIITLVIFSAVLLGISAWWFTHFEFVPREDAE